MTSFADPAAPLLITLVIDGPLTGGLPKAVELTALADIADLSEYGLGSANNGGGTDGVEATLPAVALARGERFYVATEATGFTAWFGFAPDMLSAALGINGDDAIELFRNGTLIDVFGQQDVAGGGTDWDYLDGWAARNSGSFASTSFNANDWSFSGINALDGATSNATAATPAPVASYTPPAPLVLNEVLGSTAGDDVEFIELRGVPGASLAGLSVIVIENDAILAKGTIDTRIDLTADHVMGDNGYFLIGNALVQTVHGVTPDLEIAPNAIENSSYTIAIVRTDSLSGATATGSEVVIDAVGVSDGEPASDFYYAAPVIGPDGTFLPAGFSRLVPGVDTDSADDLALADFNKSLVINTPIAATGDSPDSGTTYADVRIHAIQGSTDLADGTLVGTAGAADESPLLGQAVRVQAVVTQVLPGLGGFFIQEEDADVDADVYSSEGVFVYAPGDLATVTAGDLVTVEGRVGEYFGQTQITPDRVTVEASGQALPSATLITFPTATVLRDADGDYLANLEAYEGMRVFVPEDMSVTELFQLDRFGTIRLSSDGRLEQFTQSNLPDVAGYAQHLRDVAARSLVLDDGATVQNPTSLHVPFLGADQTLDGGDVFRMGDVYSGLTGIIAFSEDYQSSSEEPEYRIHLPTDGTLTATNPRPATPADVGGTLKVAAFNVLNYFSSIDTTPGSYNGPYVTGPAGDQEPRGANDLSFGGLSEFDRQQAKIVEAILAMDADVIGLTEIENDPSGVASLVSLVGALNAAGGSYAYVDFGPVEGAQGGALEGDAIKNAFLYDTTTITLTGQAAILDETVDVRFQSAGIQRPALAQSFTEIASGESFTAVINHLKSKGSVVNGETAIGDGQGNNNPTRTAAAEALVDWLDTDPTGAGTGRHLILGDLNAYAMEDPVRTILAGADDSAGTSDDYVNLGARFDAGGLSYVFDGQIGTLDYALASAGLFSAVTGAVHWNINADEADALDYNLDFGRDGSLYSADPFRASDHDPVVVGLDFGTLSATRLAQFNSTLGAGGSEVVAHEDGRFYVTNGAANRIDIFTLAEGKVGQIDLTGLGTVTSVAVRNGLVAVALGNGTEPGTLALIPVADTASVTTLPVGRGPDMVTFSADGTQVYLAIEGEPGLIDPAGGITIVTLAATLAESAVGFAGFEGFDTQVEALRAAGVRIFPDQLPSTDFEPEYIAIDPQTGELIVTLQEANAVAIVDPVAQQVAEIRPLGVVDHATAGNGIDASDRDGAINIALWPVQGLRMADAVASFVVGGVTYYATANEGDARNADARVEDLVLDPTAFPDAATLQLPENLGRLEVSSIDGDTNGDGAHEALYSYGSRSFTIYDAAGTVVFDSGSFFEQYLAANFPDRFNSTQATQLDPTGEENRSDAKGPEPEAIAVTEIEGRMVAIIGMERDSGLFFFDVSNPANPRFLTYVDGVANGDYGPEVITVIPPEVSATGRTEIAVSYEESGTTSVFELTFGTPSDPADFGEGGVTPAPLDPADYGFDLQITEIWPGSGDGANLTADWIEITNLGTTAWVGGVDPDLQYDDESASFEAATAINGITQIAPGESVIVMIDAEASVAGFRSAWGAAVEGVQVGWSDGGGLGGGGDAAVLMFGAYEIRAILDTEAYPDTGAAPGRSWDVTLGAFSAEGQREALASVQRNDADEAAVGTPGAVPAPVWTLELLHISDQEAASGAVTDAANLSAVMNALEAQDLGADGIADNTIRLSSGDAFIPGVFFNASAAIFGSAGIADIQIQNELGLQAIALGNHEFDKGTKVLAELISGAAPGDFSALTDSALAGLDFTGAAMPYLSANLDLSTDANLAPLAVAGRAPTGGNSITGSTVIEENGELIGVVGATTPTLGRISSPGSVGIRPTWAGTTPTAGELDALAAEIQTEVDALLVANPEMNKVILLAHMQQIGIEQELASRLSGVDIIVAGGSNSRLVDADDRLRGGDTAQGTYPTMVANADGGVTAVVNTDGSYKYVGRLVVDFDANGQVIADSYDPAVSGAYATDAQGVADLGAGGLVDPEIAALTAAIGDYIAQTESNVFGLSDVYLNGNRSGAAGGPDGVRTQETNLGNLTADANLAAARAYDDTVMVSIKNGGGIRTSIGEMVVPPGASDYVRQPNAAITDATGAEIKPAGGISQNDIETALAFNNSLSLLTLTRAELVAVLEHGVSALPEVAGQFPQVSGVQFSFDPTAAAGSRIVNAAIVDQDGKDLDVLLRNGVLQGDAEGTVRVVTLNYLAGGGDGYPFPQAGANRVDLDWIDGDGVVTTTGAATFAEDGTEQDALAEYLSALHGTAGTAFAAVDTGPEGDTRIQNLAYRTDAVIDAPVLNRITGQSDRDRITGTDGDDLIVSGAGRYDMMTGGLGADVFVFGAEALNGLRERDIITDFDATQDVIALTDGATVSQIRQAGAAVYVYLDDPNGQDDAILLRGDGLSVDNITILENYLIAAV